MTSPSAGVGRTIRTGWRFIAVTQGTVKPTPNTFVVPKGLSISLSRRRWLQGTSGRGLFELLLQRGAEKGCDDVAGLAPIRIGGEVVVTLEHRLRRSRLQLALDIELD